MPKLHTVRHKWLADGGATHRVQCDTVGGVNGAADNGALVVAAQKLTEEKQGFKFKALMYRFHNQTLKPGALKSRGRGCTSATP